MLAFLRRRRAGVRGVRFCEACSQVCTPGCRSQALLDATHAHVHQQHPVIR
ncbi:hypothetical protein [Actinophytocola sp.]|uniref:hypothetical protein n=1 Tax=Actinophytocola sp. TaxID=1872138 RepID=UPI002ED6BD68